MRKVFCVLTALSLFLMASCGYLGGGNSVPVIAVIEGSDSPEETSVGFVELSGQEQNPSSAAEPSSNATYNSEDASEEISYEDSSEEPSPVIISEYNGFTVIGVEPAEIKDQLDAIRSYIDTLSGNMSVFYKSLDGKVSFSYGGDNVYRSASVVKAPYCKYLIDTGVDLEQTIALTQANIMAGSGTTQNEPLGTEFTVSELIKRTLVNSDNTTYKMLIDTFGTEGFNTYAASLGTQTKISSYDVLGEMSPREAVSFFEDIYESANSSSEYDIIISSLVNSTYRYLLCSGIYNSDIAHKYGYMSGVAKALHDIGIVYAEHPYVIAVMSDIDPTNGNGRTQFAGIASAASKINTIVNG